jgi:hypothetical protein
MLPAAAALAQLHNSRVDHDWDDADVCDDPLMFSYESSQMQDGLPHIDAESSYSLHNYLIGPGGHDVYHSQMPPSPLPKNISPTELMRMPLPHQSSRASSMQPFPRVRVTRPRKESVTDYARMSKYERDRTRDFKRLSRAGDQKQGSVETSSVFGNKWEDLLEAAASASEADCQSRNMTPVSLVSKVVLHCSC